MAKPEFKIEKKAGVLLVEFEIPGGVTTPEEFAAAVESLELSGPHVVCLSGRGPVWGYGMLIHEAHASQGVATLDPRLGYVVVQSHKPGVEVGSILEVN